MDVVTATLSHRNFFARVLVSLRSFPLKGKTDYPHVEELRLAMGVTP